MTTFAKDFTLAELLIVAAAQAWRDNGEILASGIGTIPRLAAGLAKLTFAPEVLMTDSEASLIEEPIPLGPRGDYKPVYSGWMPFRRVFDVVWGGKRHAMITPTQIDRWGQANISFIGGSYEQPKIQMLGVRGLPGNSINHANSMFVPAHNSRVFVAGEVDLVNSVGTNDERWGEGVRRDFATFGLIVTDLCVMDFQGPNRAIRVRSLHPGVTFEQVQAATGFELHRDDGAIPETTHPTEEQLAIIRRLDPHDMRAAVLKGNPPGIRTEQAGS